MNDLILSLNDWAAAWFPAVARTSIQGGLFILVVWGVCKAFKSLPANLRYWLWWIASAQMLIRMVLVSPIPIPILPAKSADLLPTAITAPAEVAPTDFVGIQASPPNLVPDSNRIADLPTGPSLSRESEIMLLWLAGMGIFAILSGRKLFRTRQIVRHSIPISEFGDDGESGLRIAMEIANRMGIRAPRLRANDQVRCPMLAGWIRPTILLPIGFAESESEPIIRMALAHEMAHVRRRDLWFGAVPAVSHLLLFFHPLAWLATQEVAAAREESCDIEALRVGGGSPATYARLLLDTAQANSFGAALGAAFGYRLLHRRIKMLNHSLRSGSTRTRRIAASMIVASALGALPWTVTGQSPVAGQAYPKAAISKQPAKNTAKKTAEARKPAKNSAKTLNVAEAKPGKTAAKAMTGTVTGAKTAIATTVYMGKSTGAAVFSATQSASPAKARGGNSSGVTKTAIGSPFTTTVAKVAGANSGVGTSTAIYQGNVGSPGSDGFAQETKAAAARSDGVASARAFGGGASGGTDVSQTSDEFVAQGATATSRAGGFGGSVAGMPGSGTFAATTVGEEDSHRISIRFKDIPLRTAIAEMFHAAHMNFVLRSGVQEDKVTCELTNQPIELALAAVLKGARQELTYRSEGGVYYILPKD